MPYFSLTEDKFKLVACKHFFVSPADYNYIQARFCRIAGLHKEFFWQCLQALEKYFKASLIVNNVSATGFSHNLPRLLAKHREVYGDFAVTDPVRPNELPEELWRVRTVDQVIDRIHYFGAPESRYGLRSYNNYPSDLFLLDEIVFELRRRIGRLNSLIGTDIYVNDETRVDILEQSRGLTFSELIVNHPRFQIFNMNITNASFEYLGDNLDEALYRWNFRWARNRDDLTRPTPPIVNALFGGFGNSMLYLLKEAIQKPNPTPERIEAIHQRMEWLFSNVQLERGVITEMRSLMP